MPSEAVVQSEVPLSQLKQQVRNFVHRYRRQHEITPRPYTGPHEPSCLAFGEFNNLLNSLIIIEDGQGEWREIDNDSKGEIVLGVLEEMKKPKWAA